MAKVKHQQLDLTPINQKRFSIENLVKAKLDKLSNKLDKLTYSDVVWLSRVEDFLTQHEYLTERQMSVLDTIVNRHSA